MNFRLPWLVTMVFGADRHSQSGMMETDIEFQFNFGIIKLINAMSMSQKGKELYCVAIYIITNSLSLAMI